MELYKIVHFKKHWMPSPFIRDPAPGYEDDWFAAYYPLYRDSRAVEESIVLMRSDDVAIPDYSTFISSNVKVGK
ncbi:hypothetical protein [Candidatus Epulonipiscium viviparus]|uniref:hypothetical protein n=1 Tax=Candidatus Epulonipiscium viviparus TaxID=420336 RepID=UPI002738112A|nr:hypothetical protein [Candidatus Epulopiscium viviparus]